MRRNVVPALTGAAVAAAVRYLAGGGLTLAVIGAVVVLAIVAVLVAIARWLDWPDAPVLYAVVATVAATIAFVLTKGSQ